MCVWRGEKEEGRRRQGNNKSGVGRRGEENDGGVENMRLDPFAVLLGDFSLYLCLVPGTGQATRFCLSVSTFFVLFL